MTNNFEQEYPWILELSTDHRPMVELILTAYERAKEDSARIDFLEERARNTHVLDRGEDYDEYRVAEIGWAEEVSSCQRQHGKGRTLREAIDKYREGVKG